MAEERVKLCDEDFFQCSICCNDINDKMNVYEIESCQCRFCKEVSERDVLEMRDEIDSILVCPTVLFQSSQCRVR